MGAEIVAVIPARAGSKGVPHKNIRPLGGQPLLAWSIAACLRSQRIGRVLVSTDDGEYAALARHHGAEAPFLRPASLATDGAGDLGVICHALDWLRETGAEPAYLVHMRPTTPLRDSVEVDRAIDAFVNAPAATALRSVHEMSESAYKTFERRPDGRLARLGTPDTDLDSANDARQQYPVTYHANGYVDVLSTRFIRQSGRLHGDHVMAWVTAPTVEVDTEDDFMHLECLVNRDPRWVLQVFR